MIGKMSTPKGFKRFTLFRPKEGLPAGLDSFACQRSGSKEICASCPLRKPGFEVMGTVVVVIAEKADPGSEKNGLKTWNGNPVCCHMAERVDILDNAPELKAKFKD
jgi:hypothetical protein